MPAIIKGNQHMQAVTYTGNGGTQFIYVGFKSDFFGLNPDRLQVITN